MYGILIVAYLIIALAIVVLVLMQRGKGADMGSSFGAGASATLFGSSGNGNFLTRLTTILGILFFVVSIILANMSSRPKMSYGNNAPQSNVTTQSQRNNSNEDKIKDIIPAEKVENTSPTSDIPE